MSSDRLPESVVPERYEIRLVPDLEACAFSGEETITATVREPVREIELHACDLAIESAAVSSEPAGVLVPDIVVDPEHERLRLRLPRSLPAGPCQLRLRFSGKLNEKLHGFYRSTYRAPDGRTKTMAATQFEATDARRAFPCWDEPAFKAVFQVTLVVDEALTALSNTRVLREARIPGTTKKEVVFADTIRMSTYLVAFVVGELEASEVQEVDGVPLRVWTVPGKRHLTRFALQVGSFSLDFFRRYYDRAYPGDKLDLIAIPDFASGAMENLGAITFRETALLLDERTATRAELERVADVVSHENAHMWFGDLVTMRWWNGLWLNEAFATFMEMLAVDAWKPEWQRWQSFSLSRAAALLVDGLKTTRSIEYPVGKPQEAAGMFDVLTYEKGAAVLRMLEQYLGAEVFRAGIRRYLRKHEYGNAETTDLWDAIEEASGQPVRALMDSWIFQGGYPLVTVERTGRGLRLSQRIFRYLEDGSAAPGTLWHVPLMLKLGRGSTTELCNLLLTTAVAEIETDGPVDWVVANAGGHGFYRVRYDDGLMAALQARLFELEPIERFGLLNDRWALAQSGLASLESYLELLEAFVDETDHNVWAAILSSCHYLERALADEDRAALRAFVRRILSPAAKRLGWSPQPGESELTAQLRGDLLGALGTLGEEPEVQAEARRLYARYRSDRESVDRNVVPALVSILAHCGGPSEYDEFYARFKQAPTPQDEQRYLFALAAFGQPELVERTLELTINGEVRTQNAPYLVRALLLNVRARERTWSFMKNKWEEMSRLYPDNAIPRMCEGIVALVSPEWLAEAREFFASRPVKQGLKTIEQHLEKLEIAVRCKERWAGRLRGRAERLDSPAR